jgi:hypothetical protein
MVTPPENTNSGLPSDQDRSPLQDDLVKFFMKNGLGFGGGDIMCLGSSDTIEQIAGIVRCLISFVDEEKKSPIHRILVVSPPKPDGSENVELKTRLEGLLKAIQRKLSPAPPNWIRMVTPPNLLTQTLVSMIDGAPARTVIVVNEAARFRDSKVEAHVPDAAEHLTLREDFWVPQVYAAARDMRQSVKGREVYFALNAGELSPRRAKLDEMLTSIEGVGVIGAIIDNHLDTLLAEQEQVFGRRVADGRLGAVMSAVDRLPSALDSEKPFLRIQLLHRAGLIGQALEGIEGVLDSARKFNPSALVKLAIIARQGGGLVLAARLLRLALDDLDSSEMLSLALDTADGIGESDLAARLAARLAKLYPDAVALRDHKLREVVRAGQYGDAATLLTGDARAAEATAFYKLLGSQLPVTGVPDYISLLARLRAELPRRLNQGHRILIRDAMRRGLLFHALNIALQSVANRERADIELMGEVLERVTLERDGDGNFLIDHETHKSVVTKLIRYLSSHPSAASVRVNLARLLSISVTGNLGLALIASATLDLAKQPLSLRKAIEIEGFSAEEVQQREGFVKRAFEWMGSEGELIMGRAVLPTELLTEPADKFLPVVEKLLIRFGDDLGSEKDDRAFMNWLRFGTALAPHSGDPNKDLSLIRQAAALLIPAGKMQTARDLAELVLEVAGEDAIRQRIAWSVFADIYHRLRNSTEALVALACAAAGDPCITENQAWQEADTLARLLRDIGLYDAARHVIAKARTILQGMQLAGVNSHRLDLMHLQIDLLEQRHLGEPDSERIAALLSGVTEVAKRSLEIHDDPTPVAVLMGQIVRLAHEKSVPVPTEAAKALVELLALVSPGAGTLIRAVSEEQPTAEQILALHHATERARYSQDAGFDVRGTVLAAKRLLNPPSGTNEKVIAFAIELLSDRAIALPGWETTAKPPELLTAVTEPGDIAAELSRQGIAVVMAALSEDGQLVRVSAQDGRLGPVVREPAAVFSRDRLRAWTKDYPYRYGIDEDIGNAFLLSMDGLGMSDLPNGRIVLVMDTDLQQIPANLIRVGDGFAGAAIPIASASSLAWLNAARKADMGIGARAAWISTSEKDGQTLAMIAGRLGETFTQHAVTLHTGSDPPQGLVSAELVVVAAHLLPEKRYFQRVSDEGRSIFPTSEFADALRNVGVIVLFVCSGGRADKHPDASTVVGLAKQLLDRGCTAVVASPWPLNSSVPPHWLPAFLNAWQGEVPLVDAVFEANKAVAKALGDKVAYALAMTVYGDPLRRAISK